MDSLPLFGVVLVDALQPILERPIADVLVIRGARLASGSPETPCLLPARAVETPGKTGCRPTRVRDIRERSPPCRIVAVPSVIRAMPDRSLIVGRSNPMNPLDGIGPKSYRDRRTWDRGNSGYRHQCITKPPSTLIVCPVMLRARLEARKTAMAAISSGCCQRFKGTTFLIFSAVHAS